MLTKKTRYSLLALTYLARKYGQGAIFIGEIADNEKIPKRFLEVILLELKKLGFLASKYGKTGGYFLIKNPKEITLTEIIRSMDGPIALIPCASEKFYQACEFCKDESSCKIRFTFKEIRDASYEILNRTTLFDLSNDK